MRKGLLIAWLGILLLGIVFIFWRNEWIYSQPTPKPLNYRVVNAGQRISLHTGLRQTDSKPVFLHFFNPDCPCSRFNLPHFKSLVEEYGSEVNFAVVLMTNKQYSGREIQEKFDLHIPILFDTTLAVSCGVYSTPQAVIIGSDSTLFYRGNYNKSRYCTTTQTNYAQIALQGLLHNKRNIAFNQFALNAYGCQLPECTK